MQQGFWGFSQRISPKIPISPASFLSPNIVWFSLADSAKWSRCFFGFCFPYWELVVGSSLNPSLLRVALSFSQLAVCFQGTQNSSSLLFKNGLVVDLNPWFL